MPLAVSVRFDLIDAKGKNSFTKIRLPLGFQISDYSTAAVQFAQLIANISTARITNVSFCVGLDLSGATIKAVASGLSDIAQKALFGFSTAVAGFRAKMKIPALSETKVIAGSDALDQADPDVAAFITAVENGIATPGGTIGPVDFRGNDIVTTDYSRELFRKK